MSTQKISENLYKVSGTIETAELIQFVAWEIPANALVRINNQTFTASYLYDHLTK